MPIRLPVRSPRFAWSALGGRCRARLVAGLVVLGVAAGCGIFAGRQFAERGRDARAFDQPLVRLGADLTRPPALVAALQPSNDRELYLLAVISDQRDMLFGLTVLMLRMIVTLTFGGIGIVLLTAGSTEWEVRSERMKLADARRDGATD